MSEENEREKTIFDHITGWLTILTKRGVPMTLIGLGFILVLLGNVFYGTMNSPPPAFWVMNLVGIPMIAARAYFHFCLFVHFYELSG